jgi:F-type H+-transporting ATPase subunit delta
MALKLDKYAVGAKYGKALYELAVEQEVAAPVLEELNELQAVFTENPTLSASLTDNRLTFVQKNEIVKTLTAGASELVGNFVGVLYETKNIPYLAYVIDQFTTLFYEANGIVRGVVTSAVPLTAQQKASIESGLSKRLGIDAVTLEEKVDQEIVGGVIVEANHQIIDGSVKSQLTKLQNLLKL